MTEFEERGTELAKDILRYVASVCLCRNVFRKAEIRDPMCQGCCPSAKKLRKDAREYILQITERNKQVVPERITDE